MRFRVAAVAVAGLVFCSPRIDGQVVRGVAVENDRPVSGVVVLLVDSVSQTVGRSLTTDAGEFRIAAPRAGTYQIRTLRIGFRPVLSEPFVLAAGATESRRVALVGVPAALEGVRVVDKNACRAFTDSGAAVYRVWEQVRGALISAQLTVEARSVTATTVTLEQVLDVRNDHVMSQRSNVSSGNVSRPWRTRPPDSLHRSGYVVTHDNNTVEYYAPGLDMLGEDVFVQDHCFRLVENSRAGHIGIQFEPTPERRRIPEIRGTLWVDRATSELKRLDFRYINIPSEQEGFARAEMGFARLRDGAWAVASWRIRMPVVEQIHRPGHGAEQRVTAIQLVGGDLALARRNADTLWSRPRFSVAAVVRDSVSGASIAGARVASPSGVERTSDSRGRVSIPDVLFGQQVLEVRTTALDSLNTTYHATIMVVDSTSTIDVKVPSARVFAGWICGAAAVATADGAGIVVGDALASFDSAGKAVSLPAGARVTAEWRASATEPDRVRRLNAPIASDGSFRLCGLPLDAEIALTASATGFATTKVKTVQPTATLRLVRTDLTLDRVAIVAAHSATFKGIVVSDSTKVPIEGAEVALPDLGLNARTDSAGVFQIAGIQPGDHRITVRRIGFGAADTRLSFQESETVDRRVVLGRAVVLEATTVSARGVNWSMPGFEENRRLGLGTFLTRQDIAKFDGGKLLTPLQSITSFRAVEGPSSQAYPRSSRGPQPRPCPKGIDPQKCAEMQGVYYPEKHEAKFGILKACYALVYLDGMLMNGIREPVEPFDISMISPERVEAVEWYAGPAQTPLKYNRMGARCGVLVIWTRRSP